MNITIEHNQKKYKADTGKSLDISLPMFSGGNNPNAFGIQQPKFEPFKAGNFVGSVAQGGNVNCENLFFNPHGNGTHTECLGHISKERVTINQCLKQFHFIAKLISIELSKKENDNVITLQNVKEITGNELPEALIIRSLPNDDKKRNEIYSGNNPAYLEAELCEWLREKNVKHLLIDLPSVDREEDGGTLAAHHAFWNYPQQPRFDATISEMISVPNEITDGTYLLNIQIASLETDASPSKPVLYSLSEI